MDGLLEELGDDDYGSPVKQQSNVKIITTQNQEDFLNNLEESPLVSDSKPGDQPQKFNGLEALEMENIDSGFKQNNEIMKFDMEDPEPENTSSILMQEQGKEEEVPSKFKVEEDSTPNQFVLDDLMDEFDVSKGKNDNLLITKNEKKESVQGNDLLDDFNW